MCFDNTDINIRLYGGIIDPHVFITFTVFPDKGGSYFLSGIFNRNFFPIDIYAYITFWCWDVTINLNSFSGGNSFLFTTGGIDAFLLFTAFTIDIFIAGFSYGNALISEFSCEFGNGIIQFFYQDFLIFNCLGQVGYGYILTLKLIVWLFWFSNNANKAETRIEITGSSAVAFSSFCDISLNLSCNVCWLTVIVLLNTYMTIIPNGIFSHYDC